MRLTLTDDYLSLKPFLSEELTNFAVITGKNGSGKTQLLELIFKKNKNDTSTLTKGFNINPILTKIQLNTVEKLNVLSVSNQLWNDEINKYIGIFNRMSNEERKLFSYVTNNKLQYNSPDLNSKFLSEDLIYKELVSKIIILKGSNIDVDLLQPFNQSNAFNSEAFTNNRFLNLIEIISNDTRKEFLELESSDFFLTSIPDRFIDEDDLFKSQIELIFFNYAKRRDKNKRLYFDKREYGRDNQSIPDTEFISKNIPPWTLVNEILNRHHVGFYFKEIDDASFEPNLNIDLQLIKSGIEQRIEFSNLSSGEKIIIGLILKLFTSEYYGQMMSFPDLILLDEPDSHLHPEMSKLLVDVLENTFVNKLGIKVIMTTHSPSTIALCPENNVFQLTNGNYTSLKNIAKDDALKLLTDFIPTLSINYKSHRQIFVESPTDVYYFQALSDKHSQNIKLYHKLYYISNSYGKGNCSQVYDVVDKLVKGGNNTCFGIVDWDINNKPAQSIYVHGMGFRYSVENYLLDPLYIMMLLLENNNAHNIAGILGINEFYNPYTIGNEDETVLQRFIAEFFSLYESVYASSKYDSDKMEIEYLNKKKVKIPIWYLREQGHLLVTKLKEVFSMLGAKYKDEGKLQKELTKVMAKCYPFVPMDSIQLIETLALPVKIQDNVKIENVGFAKESK